MGEKQALGTFGEEQAAVYLKAKGYRMLERNFKGKRGEIDIIAQRERTIAFVEVKTRRGNAYGKPCQSVDKKKMGKIRSVAEEYLVKQQEVAHGKGLDDEIKKLECRIDVIEVQVEAEKVAVRHLTNCF